MLTNEKALKALGIFRACMKEDFDFDLKYGMGRNIDFLEPVAKAVEAAMDARGLPGFKEFEVDRKVLVKKYMEGGRLSQGSVAMINSELEEKHPLFCSKFKELEDKHDEFLDQELDPNIRIYKIKKELFPKPPKTFKYDTSVLLAFIESGDDDEKSLRSVPDSE